VARFGVDFSFDPPSIPELLAAGVTFAIRYLSDDSRKNLTPPEARRLSDAGIDLVVVWQTSKGFMLEGHDAGARDAAAARAQADACGMPDGRPIYFALDIDPNPLTEAQWAQVDGYLDGAASVLGQPAIGVYGGWQAIDRLVGGGLAAWGFQTSSWSAGWWSPLAHLQQYAHNVALGSGLVDHDRATSDNFGQWRVGMQLVTRAQWGARPPKNQTPLNRAVQHGTAVHYTASDADEQADHANCARRVRAIQDFHMDGRGWADIAYSYLACKHGFVYEGRGTGVRTAANGTDTGNTAYHAVCFLGDDTAGRDDVTDAGRVAIRQAVEHCNRWAGVSAFRPHSWFKATACPGDQLRAWLAAGMPVTDAAPPQEDDMTEDQARQLAAIHAALTVPGTTSPEQTVNLLFDRVRSIDGIVKAGIVINWAPDQLQQLAETLAPLMAASLADQVADKLAARLAE